MNTVPDILMKYMASGEGALTFAGHQQIHSLYVSNIFSPYCTEQCLHADHGPRKVSR